MSGLEVFGAAAAIPTIVTQLLQFISSTKEALKGIREAVEKHGELTQDLISISKIRYFRMNTPSEPNSFSKVIECAGKTMKRLVEGNGAASLSVDLNFEPLIQQMERHIEAAQRKLKSLEPGSSLRDRRNFAKSCRVEIEAVIAKVNQTGMFLNITLVNLLMKTIVEESSSTSLKQSLINSGIQPSLNETLEAVKDAVRDVLSRSAETESQGLEDSTEEQLADEPSKPESIKSTISGKSSWYKRRRDDSNGGLRQKVVSKVKNSFTSFTSKSHLSEVLLESDVPAIPPEPVSISTPENVHTSVDTAEANDGSPDQGIQSHITETNVPLPDMGSLMQNDTTDLGSPQAGLAVPDVQGQMPSERDAKTQESCLNDEKSKETDEMGTSANFIASNTSGYINSPRLMDILRNNTSTCKISQSHKPTDAIEQNLLDTRSWVSAAIEDEMPYGVLVFQRPDNWIQLAILPRDHDGATVLETPLLKAMENTPLSCHFEYIDSDSRNLRIYFFTANEERLSICTVGFRPPFLIGWSVIRFPNPSGNVPSPLPGMGFFYSTDHRTISYSSATGSLVSLSEREAGQWVILFSSEKHNVCHGDQVTQRVKAGKSEEDEETTLTLRIYREGESTTHEFVDVDSWHHSFRRSDKVEISKKDIHWQGLTIDKTSIPYMPIEIQGYIVGFFCKTVENKVYLVEGHPWYHEQQEPIYICTVQPGTNFSFSRAFNDLLFISVEGNLSRIRVEVSESDCISWSQPKTVLDSSSSSQQLTNVSYPGIIRA